MLSASAVFTVFVFAVVFVFTCHILSLTGHVMGVECSPCYCLCILLLEPIDRIQIRAGLWSQVCLSH